MATAPTPGPPVDPPDLDAVKALAERLAPHIVQTPVVRWAGPREGGVGATRAGGGVGG